MIKQPIKTKEPKEKIQEKKYTHRDTLFAYTEIPQNKTEGLVSLNISFAITL